MTVETPFRSESRYAGMWMLIKPWRSMMVLFSLMPFCVPPSPTKCLAHAATLFLRNVL